MTEPTPREALAAALDSLGFTVEADATRGYEHMDDHEAADAILAALSQSGWQLRQGDRDYQAGFDDGRHSVKADSDTARYLIHDYQQAHGGLCKPGDDHREAGPCHDMLNRVLPHLEAGSDPEAQLVALREALDRFLGLGRLENQGIPLSLVEFSNLTKALIVEAETVLADTAPAATTAAERIREEEREAIRAAVDALPTPPQEQREWLHVRRRDVNAILSERDRASVESDPPKADSETDE